MFKNCAGVCRANPVKKKTVVALANGENAVFY